MVSSADKDVGCSSSNVTTGQQSAILAIQTWETASTTQETSIGCLPFIRKSLQSLGFSESATNIITYSWRTGTKKQYKTYLQRWIQFCNKRKIDPVSPTVNTVIEFLTILYEDGLQYSALNTARSAISTVVTLAADVSVGKHPLVTRFMKGVFQLRPALPRYTETWNVGVVIKYLSNMAPTPELTMEHLTKKLTMLLALLSGQRTQTLAKLSTDFMVLTSEKCSFTIPELLKHTRPGSHQKAIVINAYPNDRRLCTVSILGIYLEKTKGVRNNETQLLLSYRKPYKRVSRDTISRWLKCVMKNAGIDTDKFKSHSTRSAAVSAANRAGIPMDTILSAAGWSNTRTFDQFYNKNITEQGSFANTVLDASAGT